MKLKSMISWALIFSFTLLLFQPLMEAKEIESAQIKAELARLNERYQRIDNDLKKFQQASKTAKSPLQVKKAKAQDLMFDPNSEDMSPQDGGDSSSDQSTSSDTTTTDSSTSSTTDTSTDTITTSDISTLDSSKMQDYFVGIDMPKTAYAGDYIPVSVAAVVKDGVDLQIDKINLLISDPKTGNQVFKDTFENSKNQTKILFTYNWDTEAAQTNAGVHHITAEIVWKKNSYTGSLVTNATGDIEIKADPGIDLMNHGFWGGYIKEDGSLNSYWLGKLGCKNASECKTRQQIRDHLTSAISNGDFETDENGAYHTNSKFNEGDQLELDNTNSRYLRAVKNNIPSDQQQKINVSAYALSVSDLNNFVQEAINSKLGIETPQLSEETATAPELGVAMGAYNKYSVKIAACAPGTPEELKQCSFYNDLLADAEKMSQDAEDNIDSIKDLNPDLKTQTSLNNHLQPKRAKAWVQIAVGVGFCLWDIYQLVKHPSWGNAGMLALDTLLIPFGGASLAEKIVAHVGSWLGKVVKIGEAAKWVSKWWKTSKACEVIGNVWKAVKGWKVWDSPAMKAVVQGVKEWASDSWVALTGFWKKALSWGKAILRWGLFLAARSWWSDTSCPGIKILGLGGTLDPFAWALCNILKFFFDLGASIYNYSMCLLKNALGVGNKPTQCQFKYGAT